MYCAKIYRALRGKLENALKRRDRGCRGFHGSEGMESCPARHAEVEQRRERSRTGRATCSRILLQRDRLLRFFDELFKARVAAQWIIERQQFQFAIAEVAWAADNNGKLFAGEIFLTNPCSYRRQILDHVRAIH